jgi:hypothetical protein
MERHSGPLRTLDPGFVTPFLPAGNAARPVFFPRLPHFPPFPIKMDRTSAGVIFVTFFSGGLSMIAWRCPVP